MLINNHRNHRMKMSERKNFKLPQIRVTGTVYNKIIKIRAEKQSTITSVVRKLILYGLEIFKQESMEE